MKRAGLRVVVAGAGGKMGQTLIDGVRADKSLVLAAALDVRGSPSIGTAVGGVKVGSDPGRAIAAADVLIDFTRGRRKSHTSSGAQNGAVNAPLAPSTWIGTSRPVFACSWSRAAAIAATGS